MSSEFDSILGEETPTAPAPSTTAISPEASEQINSRNIIGLPESSQAATLEPQIQEEEFDPFSIGASPNAGGGGGSTARLEEMVRKKERRTTGKVQPSGPRIPIADRAKNYIKGKDFGELFFFVFVPITAAYYFGNKAYTMGSTKMENKGEETLDAYANEMIYHDGDFEEMRLCNEDYSKKLMWMGPGRGDVMIKRYLEFYAKKKTVSPQAISSLSYVFSMYKLSEDRAAKILTELVSTIPEKVASAGKILFFGEHIFKTPEARAKLDPIKKFLAAQYNDLGSVSGEDIVDRSQLAMGEAAYKSAVARDGKVQGEEELTLGWEVLGLEREMAVEIWEDVKEGGFKTAREEKYASLEAGTTFDKNGRRVDGEGKLENGEEAGGDDDEDDDDDDGSPTGSVYECGECGFTLFIAEGRDFKFFGDDFKCSECGAGKDQFVGMNK